MSVTSKKLSELKFARMRLGQAVGEPFPLLSQPEVSVTLVPLTEAENYACMEIITTMEAPETIVGAMLRDRRNSNEIIFRAARDPENLDEPAFASKEEMMDLLEHADINHLYDCYMEMAEEVSPPIGNFTDEDIEIIKKVLAEMDMNEFSGRQWYALKRFLSLIGYEQLPDNLPGSISTNLLTMTNGDQEFTREPVSPSLTETTVKSVESQ